MTNEQGLLFAGQGAQFIGMGRDLAEVEPECKALFARANDILGYDLTDICFNGPESELVKTVHCQNAIFVTSVVCYAALRARLIKQRDVSSASDDSRSLPFISVVGAAGLSLGEWSALHVAGAVSFDDALRALHARGSFMQDACEERDGAMLSVIGLDEEAARDVANKAGVETANFNSPEQIVLSGERERIKEAEKIASAAGAKRVIQLNVAGAYHSSLMASAAERLKGVLSAMEFRVPCFPVISNVTGLPHGDAEAMRSALALQVVSPVRWVSSIRELGQRGACGYVEFGPGRVLSGLVKRTQSEAATCNIQDVASLEKALALIAS